MKFETLHEAIIYLLSKERRPYTFEEIASLIKKENLWKRPSDGLSPQAFQIRLRTVIQKKYKDQFK